MLEFENVTYKYSENTPFEMTAVDGVNLKICDGIVTGLIGHTGSGKSTLSMMMNALVKPTSGRVLLDGKDIWEKGYDTLSVRYKVGLVFQYPEYQLFEETVEKDIAFGPKNMGLSEKEIKERVMRAAEFTGLTEEMLGKSPFELSGGQKRRVAIAGSIAMEPDILVLDEPAAGLDPRGKNEILGHLCEYQKKRGNTLVVISHSMEDIALYADRIVTMSHGKVLLEGTPGEVFKEHKLLLENGLSVPQVTKIMGILREKGFCIDDSVYTPDEAVKAILEAVNAI